MVIAYLVADDERTPVLNKFAREELDALKTAAINTDTRLAAYVDFTGSGKESQSQICFVDGKNGDVTKACSDTPETNVATPTVLRSFFDFARARSEKDSRYAVFFWGHGAGPAGLFLDPAPSPAQTLSLPQLWQALQVFPDPVDVILFKDCWVSTLEVAYELDDTADVMIASQGLVPILGAWPYANMFDALRNVADPIDNAGSLTLLELLHDHYNDEKNRGMPPLDHVVYSALHLKTARKQIAPNLRQLVLELKNATDDRKVLSRKAMEKAVGGDPALIDVKMFCELLQPLGDGLGDTAGKLGKVLNEVVLGTTKGTTSSGGAAPTPPANMNGVGLFRRPQTLLSSSSNFVTEIFYSNYEELSISGVTGWIDIAFETVFS
jgi:hypothetical protein